MFKRLGNSFKYAAHGIVFCVRHEMNMRIHIVATMCVLYLSQFYNFTKEQFILLIITCVTVISAEMMNTAIEVVIDKVSPGYSALGSGILKNLRLYLSFLRVTYGIWQC